MFKRPKSDAKSVSGDRSSSERASRKNTSTEDSSSSEQRASAMRPINEQKAEGQEAPSGRTVTPSYEVRKPTVRTLQTSPSTGNGAATNAETATPAANLHVGRGLKLEGKIQSCDSLVIEGDVQATIESGSLTVSETGDVRGEATVDEAEINGKFDGTLLVRKCLTINSTGRVTGSVRYGELKVEQGGQMSGDIQAEGLEVKSSKPKSDEKSDKEDKSQNAAASML